MGEQVREILKYYRRLAKGGRNEADFFELVRRVESASGRRDVGKSSARDKEPVRFGQLPHLNFAESAVAEIVERAVPAVLVNFMGLWGPNGPMPLELTGYVYQRMHNYGDNAPRRFADIVNHRFIGLYYRAWKSYEQAALFDKPAGGLVAAISSSLAGRPCRGSGLGRFADARSCGLFGVAVKSRDGLTTLLRNSMGLPLEVRVGLESTGEIPAESRCRLGSRGEAELGISSQLGRRYRTCSRSFEVVVGPVAFAVAKDLLPGSAGYCRLVALVHSYLDRPYEWKLRLRVKSATVPVCRLDKTVRLGRDARVGRHALPIDELVFESFVRARARRDGGM